MNPKIQMTGRLIAAGRTLAGIVGRLERSVRADVSPLGRGTTGTARVDTQNSATLHFCNNIDRCCRRRSLLSVILSNCR